MVRNHTPIKLWQANNACYTQCVSWKSLHHLQIELLTQDRLPLLIYANSVHFLWILQPKSIFNRPGISLHWSVIAPYRFIFLKWKAIKVWCALHSEILFGSTRLQKEVNWVTKAFLPAQTSLVMFHWTQHGFLKHRTAPHWMFSFCVFPYYFV